MGDFFRRIHYLLNRRRLERELQNDIDVHREMMPAGNRKDFGNPALLRERSREAWGWSWLDRLGQDLRFGARLLKKSPALALTAIAVLALGIGVNVTAFNIVDVMFFKPLPVRAPHSLVRFSLDSPTLSSTEVPYPAVEFYASNSNGLSAVMAQTSTSITLTGAASENVHAGLVTANYFSELGSSAAYGRLFDPRIDDLPDSPPVVVLGYRYWQNRFGGAPAVVGRTIRLNQRPATVIGVTSFDFSGLDPERGEADGVWLMISKLPYFVPETKLLTSFDFNDSGVHMFGRLKPGITGKAAEAALMPVKVAAVVSGMGGLALALAIVGLYGVVSYGVSQRIKEIGIRIALGATSSRLVHEMVSSIILPLGLAIGAGLGFAALLSTVLRQFLYGVSNWDPLSYTGAVLLLGVTGSVAALIPARRALKVDPMVALRCE